MFVLSLRQFVHNTIHSFYSFTTSQKILFLLLFFVSVSVLTASFLFWSCVFIFPAAVVSSAYISVKLLKQNILFNNVWILDVISASQEIYRLILDIKNEIIGPIYSNSGDVSQNNATDPLSQSSKSGETIGIVESGVSQSETYSNTEAIAHAEHESETIADDTDDGMSAGSTAVFLDDSHFATTQTNINEELERMINLILRDFVQTWYKELSSHHDVIEDINDILYRATSELVHNRLSRVNQYGLVTDFIKCFSRHLSNVQTAKAVLRTQPRRKVRSLNIPGSPQIQRIKSVEEAFSLKFPLHVAIDNSTSSEINYIRSLIDVISTLAMPQELHRCKIVKSLLTEIISCNCLLSVIEKFADADWVHQKLIVLLSDSNVTVLETEIVSGSESCPSIIPYDDEFKDCVEPDLSHNSEFAKCAPKLISPSSQDNCVYSQIIPVIPPTPTQPLSHSSSFEDQCDSPASDVRSSMTPDSFVTTSLARLFKLAPQDEITVKSICNEERLDSALMKKNSKVQGLVLAEEVSESFKAPCNVNVVAISGMKHTRSSLDCGRSLSPDPTARNSVWSFLSEPRKTLRSVMSNPDLSSLSKEQMVLPKQRELHQLDSTIEKPTSSKKAVAKYSPIHKMAFLRPLMNAADQNNSDYSESPTPSPRMTPLTSPRGSPLESVDVLSDDEDADEKFTSKFFFLSSQSSGNQIDDYSEDDDDDDVEDNVDGDDNGDVEPTLPGNDKPLYLFQDVSIPSTSVEKELGSSSQYTLYVLLFEAWHCFASGAVLKPGTVQRRFREFINLQARLEDSSVYKKSLKGVKCPKRWMQLPFGNMDKENIESRRKFLESFMKSLIKKEDICNGPELKEFLAYDGNGHIAYVRRATDLSVPRIDQMLVRTVSGMFDKIATVLPTIPPDVLPSIMSRKEGVASKVQAEGEEDTDTFCLNFAVVKDQQLQSEHSKFMQTYLEEIQSEMPIHPSAQAIPLSRLSVGRSEKCRDEIIRATLSEGLLNNLPRSCGDGADSPDYRVSEASHQEQIPLAAAMFDLVVQSLQGRDCWVCRERVVDAVRIVTGQALEHWLHEQVAHYTSGPQCVYYLIQLRESFWPGGQLSKESQPIRNTEQMKVIKEQARECLKEFLPGILPKCIGDEDFTYGIDQILDCLQHEKLNKHFIYSFLDILVEKLFPELVSHNAVASGGAAAVSQ